MPTALTYPFPDRAVRARCSACDIDVAGALRGANNFRYVLKELKRHEELQHPPYLKDVIIPALVKGVEEINDGEDAPQPVGRYVVEPFES